MNNGNRKGVSINKIDTVNTNDNGDIIVRRAIIENADRMADEEEWHLKKMFHFQNHVCEIIDDYLCEGLINMHATDSPIVASMSVAALASDSLIPKVNVSLKAIIKGRKEVH